MNEPREQLLISRLTDGDCSQQEWREFEVIADADPLLWKQLAQSQRDQSAMARAMDQAGEIAQAIEIPQIMRSLAVANQTINNPALHSRFGRFGAWTGWAAAAVLALIASGHFGQSHINSPNGETQMAGLGGTMSLADLRQAYLDQGKASGEVIGEMPTKVLLESRPAPTGKGYELVYLRQMMERTVVPDLYEVNGQNELGQPTLGRYEQPVRDSM